MFSHVGQERSFQECRSNRPRQSRKIVFPWRFYSKATWRIDKQLTWWRDTTRHPPCQPPQHASQRIHSFRVDWDREKWYVLYPDFVLLLHRQRDNVAYIRAADVQRVQEKKRERGKKKKKWKLGDSWRQPWRHVPLVTHCLSQPRTWRVLKDGQEEDQGRGDRPKGSPTTNFLNKWSYYTGKTAKNFALKRLIYHWNVKLDIYWWQMGHGCSADHAARSIIP